MLPTGATYQFVYYSTQDEEAVPLMIVDEEGDERIIVPIHEGSRGNQLERVFHIIARWGPGKMTLLVDCSVLFLDEEHSGVRVEFQIYLQPTDRKDLPEPLIKSLDELKITEAANQIVREKMQETEGQVENAERTDHELGEVLGMLAEAVRKNTLAIERNTMVMANLEARLQSETAGLVDLGNGVWANFPEQLEDLEEDEGVFGMWAGRDDI